MKAWLRSGAMQRMYTTKIDRVVKMLDELEVQMVKEPWNKGAKQAYLRALVTYEQLLDTSEVL